MYYSLFIFFILPHRKFLVLPLPGASSWLQKQHVFSSEESHFPRHIDLGCIACQWARSCKEISDIFMRFQGFREGANGKSSKCCLSFWKYELEPKIYEEVLNWFRVQAIPIFPWNTTSWKLPAALKLVTKEVLDINVLEINAYLSSCLAALLTVQLRILVDGMHWLFFFKDIRKRGTLGQNTPGSYALEEK